jgi:hypothetical protein
MQILLAGAGFGLGVAVLPAFGLVDSVASAGVVMTGFLSGLLGLVALSLSWTKACRAVALTRVLSLVSATIGCGIAIWMLVDHDAASDFLFEVVNRLG